MKIRNLEIQDAGFMLEWMHDEDVVKDLAANFLNMTIEDCEAFIKKSRTMDEDIHLACCNDDDEYMGTVSLKHINRSFSNAEFAICFRKCAMGKGYSEYGMRHILQLGKNLGIDKIYWCVSEKNTRAVRFYDKNQYERTDRVPQNISEKYTSEQLKDFIWYVY